MYPERSGVGATTTASVTTNRRIIVGSVTAVLVLEYGALKGSE
jgi:hypothetical protein